MDVIPHQRVRPNLQVVHVVIVIEKSEIQFAIVVITKGI
jgi:hypothetical protein